jgi:hypothetical protein
VALTVELEDQLTVDWEKPNFQKIDTMHSDGQSVSDRTCSQPLAQPFSHLVTKWERTMGPAAHASCKYVTGGVDKTSRNRGDAPREPSSSGRKNDEVQHETHCLF